VSARAVGLLLGFAADRVLGDPRRLHPVAGFGIAAAALERRLYADSRPRGAAHTAALVGAAVLVGAATERRVRRPVARAGATAVATWMVLGGRSLEREALVVDAYLGTGNLGAARQRLTHLVGRDTSALDASEVARAVVESVAENTSDAVVAPIVWGAVAGIPGLLGHRATNTLDAMVGHRNDRYERFGWAAARLDDLVNLPGSRLAGAAVLLASPRTAPSAARAWRRDAAAHPSPNAGVVEATFAGALGLRIGGTNRYDGERVEHRAVMGDGRAARPEDIARATRLARRIGIASAVVSACIASVWTPGAQRVDVR
jgi:adenosylcobinamide-phosphate synthase